GYQFCVYGDAELFGETDTRVWPRPKQVPAWVEFVEQDAWLILKGIRLTGVCVVGLIRSGRRLTYGTVSYDPSPEPHGKWLGISTKGGTARWHRIRRKTSWEWIAGVERGRAQARPRQDPVDHRP